MSVITLSGSIGDELVVGRPDADNEVEFEIYNQHYGISAVTYLGPEARRQLVEWLQEIDR